MDREARLATHAHALRRRRHAFVRGHDERVSSLVRQVVVLLEHGQLDRTEASTDFGEGEPAYLDEAEERLGGQQAEVLVRVAHVPVGRDERRHGVEDLGRLERVGNDRLVRKVSDFDPGRQEARFVFFGRQLDCGQVRRDFGWDGRDGFRRWMGGGRSVGRGGICGVKGEIGSYSLGCDGC